MPRAARADAPPHDQTSPAEILEPALLEVVYGVPVMVERLASGHTVCAPDVNMP
jgi:hypothetical protein